MQFSPKIIGGKGIERLKIPVFTIVAFFPYAISCQGHVIIYGQGLGLFIYLHNLYFIRHIDAREAVTNYR